MPTKNLSSQQALTLLKEGNQRFSSGLRSLEAAMSVAKMKDLAQNGQNPFAIVLTCSDSRVPAEMIFDRGLGDLFVIRIAGNIVSSEIIASIEFAALNFGSPVCVVMGHSGCGAIKAAIEVEKGSGLELTKNLSGLVNEIIPAVKAVSFATTDAGKILSEATIHNVTRSAQLLSKQSPVLEKLSQEGKFKITSAIYDISTGVVTFDPASTERTIHFEKTIKPAEAAYV